MKPALYAFVAVLLAAPAWAQTPYVAGAIGAEIVRSTSVKSPGSTFDSGNGESWSGAIRVGTFVAPRYGVELEFLRPGEIEGDDEGPIYIAGEIPRPVLGSLIADGVVPNDLGVDVGIFPIINQQTRMRTTTVSTLAFARQTVGEHVDLVYLGGVGFSRVVQEIEFGFSGPLFAAGRPVPSYKTRTTQYGVGPVVGAEARIAMTEHARIVAGIRLHALGQSLVDGWIIRPSVGLAWAF